jgi:2-polyprenyl-3-methyl-5-hydroxy-6-metoxy-1,4-benzoquinol methylase
MMNWQKYWSKKPSLFVRIMEESTGYFAEQVIANHILLSNSKVLDIGCGPGFLIPHIEPFIKSYYGVDTAEPYIHHCQSLYVNKQHLYFEHLSGTQGLGSFSCLQHKKIKFNLIVVLSVIQYLPNNESLMSMLKQATSLLEPGGSILLADVMHTNEININDLRFMTTYSIKKRFFWTFCTFLLRAKFSVYKQLRKSQKLLLVNEKQIIEMADLNGLMVKNIPGLTLQQSRSNYLFTLKA